MKKVSQLTATVTFILPKGDDRDFDTVVALSVLMPDGKTPIAQNLNIAPSQRFADPGTYGPFPLDVGNLATTKEQFLSGSTTLTIYPNGHDRWITDAIVLLQWPDGSALESESHNVILDQDVNSTSWRNGGARTKGWVAATGS